jgi:hypothetical protein
LWDWNYFTGRGNVQMEADGLALTIAIFLNYFGPRILNHDAALHLSITHHAIAQFLEPLARFFVRAGLEADEMDYAPFTIDHSPQNTFFAFHIFFPVSL